MSNLKTDSLLTKLSSKDTLFTFNLISPSVYDPEVIDTMKFIQILHILKTVDSVPIKKDINCRENWVIKKTGRNSANMTMTILKED